MKSSGEWNNMKPVISSLKVAPWNQTQNRLHFLSDMAAQFMQKENVWK
jgi:hypothetical protein